VCKSGYDESSAAEYFAYSDHFNAEMSSGILNAAQRAENRDGRGKLFPSLGNVAEAEQILRFRRNPRNDDRSFSISSLSCSRALETTRSINI
jgi:hypothetical protein